ncbi:MAG TPA: hypothetical protein VJN43_05160 [Bryobacteraceae bacterium]|nr:hypothetical protein [Bryobacteraceae bacterium]
MRGDARFQNHPSKHWRVAKEFTLSVAEAMPAEGYDFKPQPEEMSFGRLMMHIGADRETGSGF